MRKVDQIIIFAAIAGLVGYSFFSPNGDTSTTLNVDQVEPNWAAIAAWPKVEAAQVAAQPDPNRLITTIVLDDSGSMGADMEAAKQAVVDALQAMRPTDRVAVTTLNGGIVIPFTDVADARSTLPTALVRIQSNGRTPLTRALLQAQGLLEEEASTLRGFGTYRMIVTTDGAADDGRALTGAVQELAATTPIQLTTIGIDIGGNHVLRRSDLGSFVDVANVAALGQALQAAIAENTDFTAITDFNGSGG